MVVLPAAGLFYIVHMSSASCRVRWRDMHVIVMKTFRLNDVRNSLSYDQREKSM